MTYAEARAAAIEQSRAAGAVRRDGVRTFEARQTILFNEQDGEGFGWVQARYEWTLGVTSENVIARFYDGKEVVQ